MSVSMYTSQVDRLRGDLAGLRSRLADERRKLADANAKAMKAVEALRKASSASQFSTRTRDVDRHQKAAAGHEKRAADFEKKIAEKEKSLSSAESNLDRARRSQQKKDDREAEKRRKADLDHLQEMERERRRAVSLPTVQPRVASSSPPPPTRSRFDERYDVCLSFAGEQRDYVERIAKELTGAGLKVFYDQDKDIAAMLWGRDLGEVLDYVYREGSRFCLMFISADYAAKAWTQHERRSALARAIEEEEYVLPARFDDTELPGLRPTVAYVDLREIAPATLVDFVVSKLGGVRHSA